MVMMMGCVRSEVSRSVTSGTRQARVPSPRHTYVRSMLGMLHAVEYFDVTDGTEGTVEQLALSAFVTD